MSAIRWVAGILAAAAIAIAIVPCSPITVLSEPEPAFAAIQVGGNTLEGYEPQDVVSTDQRYSVDVSSAAPKLETTVIKIIKVIN